MKNNGIIQRLRYIKNVPRVNDPDIKKLTRVIQNSFTGIFYCHRFRMVLSLCKMPVDRVLEIGYGAGFLAYMLIPYVHEYYGVDIHKYSSEVGKAFLQEGIKNVSFCTGDARNMIDVPSNYFDLVVSVSCLEHIKEQDRVQKEIYRVLKPNGCAVYGVPVKNILSRIGIRLLGYNDNIIHPSAPQDVLTAAKRQGFMLEYEQFFPKKLGYRLGLYWAGRFIKG